MAWRRPGDKPLSEPMMDRLPTHICVTRPQWVNDKTTPGWIPVIPEMVARVTGPTPRLTEPSHLREQPYPQGPANELTHWGRVTHVCVGKLTNIGSDNGLSPGRRQAIIWTNAGTLLIEPLGTNFNELLILIHTFSFNKMHLKMSSAKWRPFCLGLNELTHLPLVLHICITESGQYWFRRQGDKPLPESMLVLLSIGLLGTNCSEIWIRNLSFPFKKMHLKLSAAKMAAILSTGDELKQHTAPSELHDLMTGPHPVWPWNLMDDLEQK